MGSSGSTLNTSGAVGLVERGSGNAVLEEISQALHDLCQPLTTLQCRLELAGIVGTLEAHQAAANAGLAECARLVERVESMRAILRMARLAEEGALRPADETAVGAGAGPVRF